MSDHPSAFGMLSAMEDETCGRLSACLAKRVDERKQLQSGLEAVQCRRREMDMQPRLCIGKNIKASELAIWEMAELELKTRMDEICSRISEVRHEEKELRASLFTHIGKHHTWETMLDNETKRGKRLAVRTEQRAVDDLIAHRPRRPA